MAQVLFPGFRATDANGAILSGAKMRFDEAGTTTKLDTYTDEALSIAHANPVVADSGGFFATIYVGPDEYKATLLTSADVEVWDSSIDDLSVIDPVTASAVTSETITSNDTVAAGDLDRLFNIDASSGDVTLTADSAALGSGFRFSVRLSSATNSAITQAGGGQTINGSSSLTLSTQYDTASYISNGANGWDILAQTYENLAEASAAEIRNGTSGVAVSPSGIESAAAAFALTDASVIAVDWDTGINFTVTLTDNRTLGFPTNVQPGTWRRIEVTQDGTGSRTLAFTETGYYAAGGTAPTLSTGAADVDVFYLYGRTTSIVEVYVGGIDMVQIA
ncbi:MAG: hypothetical protein GY807_21090 [Gammaproteobacteria bacterium]|nr:hypothetical protein [Gammaproteobacteria bacterium]